MPVTLAIESPLQDDVRTLIAELNTVLLELSPPEACYHLTVEQMAEPAVTVWIARDGNAVIGCGALKLCQVGANEHDAVGVVDVPIVSEHVFACAPVLSNKDLVRAPKRLHEFRCPVQRLRADGEIVDRCFRVPTGEGNVAPARSRSAKTRTIRPPRG